MLPAQAPAKFETPPTRPGAWLKTRAGNNGRAAGDFFPDRPFRCADHWRRRWWSQAGGLRPGSDTKTRASEASGYRASGSEMKGGVFSHLAAALVEPAPRRRKRPAQVRRPIQASAARATGIPL